MLADAGFPAVEATAFVSPKWVPQMADAADVMARIARKAGVRYPVLTPNLKGFEGALAAKADEVVVFVAASESVLAQEHQLLDRRKPRARAPVFDAANASAACACAAAISCVLGCPYEGDVDPRKVAEVAAALHAIGAYEVVARRHDRHRHRRQDAARWCGCVAERVPVDELARPFPRHVRPGARERLRGLELGVATFDCSVAGLGGCPYAKGATGNVASEDVVYLLHGLGIETGVDMRQAAARRQVHLRFSRASAGLARRARARREGSALIRGAMPRARETLTRQRIGRASAPRSRDARGRAACRRPASASAGWTPRPRCASAACARIDEIAAWGDARTTTRADAYGRKSRVRRARIAVVEPVPDADR